MQPIHMKTEFAKECPMQSVHTKTEYAKECSMQSVHSKSECTTMISFKLEMHTLN